SVRRAPDRAVPQRRGPGVLPPRRAGRGGYPPAPRRAGGALRRRPSGGQPYLIGRFAWSLGLATSMRRIMADSKTSSSPRAGPAAASAAARWGYWPLAAARAGAL